jgi:ABC-type glycerol-3-phosphate transport system substrate-binding protein
MSNKMSRREMMKATAAGAAGLAAAAAPGVTLASEATSPPQQDEVTIRFQDSEERYAPITEAFNQMQPGTNIEYISITGIDHEEVASKILAQLAAGQPLDIGYAATEATVLYAAQGISASLTDRVMDSADDLAEYFADVSPVLTEAMMWEGDLYELPRDFNCPNMYFNMNMMEKAGLDLPGEDWTKDDFVEIARALTNLDGEDTFGYGWTNRLWGSWGTWQFVNEANILTEERAPGGEWLWDNFYADEPTAEGRGGGWRWPTPQANSPEMVETLEFVYSLFEEGLTPSIDLGGGDSLQGFFTSDKLGMTPAGGFWAGGLNEAGMENGSFDVQFWPEWKSQKHQMGTGGHWLFSGGGNQDRAWEYLKFSISLEAMQMNTLFVPTVFTTPARRSMATEAAFAETGPPNSKVFYATLDERPDTTPIPGPPASNEMTNIFTRYTGLAMTGEQSPQDALDGMQAELEALWARQ